MALVREPARRLASHYDYLHWGPRSPWATFWKGQDASAPSFDACVAARARGEPATRGDRADCLYWANAQLSYFCGVAATCGLGPRLRARTTGAAALRRALVNIDAAFAVVGLVEDLAAAFMVLERVLPSYFAGVAAAYAAAATRSRANTAALFVAAPAADLTTAAAAANATAFLRHRVLHWEYALYDRLGRTFRHQARACGLRRHIGLAKSMPLLDALSRKL